MLELTKIDRQCLALLKPGEWFSANPLGGPKSPWPHSRFKSQEGRADRLHEMGFLELKMVQQAYRVSDGHFNYLRYRLKPEHAALGAQG